jgi:hypothetical protein
MIYYLVTPNFEHTMRNYLAYWAKELEPRFKIVLYDDALRARELPLGTYIFSDLERLLPAETEIATQVWEQLNAVGAKLLNHPKRTLKRYELLTMLHEKGRNRFRVVRATDKTTPLNFPVFLREEGEHSGSLTVLLRNRHQLDEALVGAVFRRHQLNTLLVVEYCDTAGSDGIYRKFSSFVVGGRVVPCHVDCSRGWVVKDTDIVDEGIMEQELNYVRTNPHREWLEETFRLAGADYGRIDYGFLNGAPQVWEINTNPVVILTPDHYSEIHMPVKRDFAAHIGPAFEAIDTLAGVSRMVPIRVAPELIARLDREQRAQQALRSRRQLMRRVTRWPAVQAVRKVIRPLMTPFAPLLARISRSRATHRSS